ncbi:MAG: hypothetical protein ABR929_05645 [Roseiarcus sp.]|jgi:hypothetical protein
MSAKENSDPDFTDEEIARRRDDAIRRAMNTPPKPLKEFVGKTERAQAQRESRVKKAARSKPKSP